MPTRTLADVHRIGPGEATAGRRFFVVNTGNGTLEIVLSGWFANNEVPDQEHILPTSPVNVWFSGEYTITGTTIVHDVVTIQAHELGWGDTAGSTLLCVKSVADLHGLGEVVDRRPPHMRMHYCPCGAPQPSGRNCSEYPDCIPQ